MLQSQVIEGAKKRRGRRYKLELKLLCVGLYRSSPKTYKILTKIFVLPAPNTLQQVIKKAEPEPGINWKVLCSTLKTIQKLPHQEKFCTLVWDETHVRPHIQYSKKRDKFVGYQDLGEGNRAPGFVDTVLVFVARSLKSTKKKWVYILGYHLSAGPVLGETIAEFVTFYHRLLAALGLTAVLSTCDGGSTNLKAYRILGGTALCPVISISGRKMSTAFDPAHLMKCARNMTINNILYVGDTAVPFDYLLNMYGFDLTNSNRQCPKLTDNHLYPSGKKKMKVSYAAQLLSRTSAILMDSMVKMTHGGLPPEAAEAVQFVLDADSMFDSLNGKPARWSPDKPLRGPLKNGSDYWAFWDYLLPKIKTWKWIHKDSGHKVYSPTPTNIEWTVNAYKAAWSTLEKEAGFTEFFVGEASQDCLESVFGQAKFLASNHRTSTATELVAGKNDNCVYFLIYLNYVLNF